MSGTLYIVGTPIGNLEDITLRALRILTSVEVIICEDTRVTGNLLTQLRDSRYELRDSKHETRSSSPLLVRSDEHTQLKMIPKVMQWLETGTDVALTTDAGMPTISDPGWKVVNAIRDAGYPIEVIPGPTALTTALAGSGFDVSKVWFVGFLPKKNNHRQEVYAEAIRQLTLNVSSAVVFYESPQRLRETLQEILSVPTKTVLEVAACGELTKLHEKFIRGSVEEVLQNLSVEIKGEWVIILKS